MTDESRMRGQDFDILTRMEKKLDETNKAMSCLPCAVNTFKIGLLEKIVFGAAAIILIAFMGAATSLILMKTPDHEPRQVKIEKKIDKKSIMRSLQIVRTGKQNEEIN